jgi:sugar phosphate isomerase/epimerase
MTPIQDRRSFIKTTTGLLAAGMIGFGFSAKKKELFLSFSTLGCPDWPLDKILLFAKEYQYKGIEIRGIQRELNLVKCNAFNSPEKIKASKKLAKDSGISFVNLGASSALHHPPGAERTKSIEEAKQFIDLAQALVVPSSGYFPITYQKSRKRK